MIYCVNCGMELSEQAKFCPKCGKMVIWPASAEMPRQSFEAPERRELEAEPVVEPAGTPSEVSVFVLGIVSLALASTGLPGPILAIITNSKVRAREAAVGPLTGKGKVGRILAKVALPLSIFFIILWTVRAILTAINTWRMFSFLRELFDAYKKYVK